MLDDLEQILKGGAEKMHEAGCSILGGHSVADDEIKFGYAVTGTIHPERVKANAGARPGDALVFTKRIGTGVIATALKRGIAADAHVAASIASMLTLNRARLRSDAAVRRARLHRCHRLRADRPRARDGAGQRRDAGDRRGRVPFLARRASNTRASGALPGGLQNNREFAACAVERAARAAPEVEHLLYDPQTSGGLLISLPEADAAALEREIPGACRVGRVVARAEKPVRIV